MMRFKQYLKEVKRDLARATKLVKNWGKRYPENPEDAGYDEFKTPMKTPLKPWHEAPHTGDEKFHDVVLGGEATHEQTHYVPLKHVYHMQGEVDRRGVLGKMAAPTDEQPYGVHYRGSIHVLDGHHRVSAARMRGETHILMKVASHPNDKWKSK